MDKLFETQPAAVTAPQNARESGAPLAARLRPVTVEEVVGQEHVLGPGTALRKAIEEGRPPSMVLYGPPGTGKTTIARIAARHARAEFEEMSAVSAGRPEVRAVIARASERLSTTGGATILFLDEIHRFNKAQQDALLPAVEDGLLTLIGATTENPYFEVNRALLSRTQIYELERLAATDVLELLRRALERGECAAPGGIDDSVLEFIAARSGGDARAGLATLELACQSAAAATDDGDGDGADGGRGAASVTLELAQDAMQRKPIQYDKGGDHHYDYISAWIKATRGSDPDASLYYLAAMLEGGEDPRFIARRMIVFASEDVGNADPQALQVAVAAAHAVEHVGLPECQFNLAQAAIFLSLAPKSHAAKQAIGNARGLIRDDGARLPPAHLRSAAYAGATKLGRGVGYDYPHERPGHLSDQELMPEGLEGLRFFEPDDGEPEMQERLADVKRRRGR